MKNWTAHEPQLDDVPAQAGLAASDGLATVVELVASVRGGRKTMSENYGYCQCCGTADIWLNIDGLAYLCGCFRHTFAEIADHRATHSGQGERP